MAMIPNNPPAYRENLIPMAEATDVSRMPPPQEHRPREAINLVRQRSRNHFLAVWLALAVSMIATSCSSHKIDSVEEQVKYGDFVAAIPRLSEMISKDPQSDRLLSLRGHANAGLGRHLEAIQDFSAAIKYSPNPSYTSDLYFQRGREYFFTKQFQKALTDFVECRKLDPNHWKGMTANYHSKTLIELGEYSQCVQDCSQRIKSLDSTIDSDAVELYSIRSDAYRAMGQVQLAESDKDTATKLKERFFPQKTR